MKENMEEFNTMKDMFEEQLQELGDSPTWDELNDAVAGPLESHYQRFVRQYRDS